MTVQYSGNLLVKVRQRPFAGLLAGPQPLAIPGYRLAPLFNAHHATAMFAAAQPADHWLTANASAGSDLHPWDEAHRVARSAQYSIYVEPDLLQEAPEGPVLPEAAAQQGFDQDWPPTSLVNPGWHLAEGFTGFEKVRAMATGTGVRIAHLDTGYWPPQVSTPRHIRRDLGYNFYENNTNTTDPGTGGLLRNPGHGTATLAIVSGNTVDLIYQGKQYTGDIGGAPDAEVVPVRIGPSVVHFYSSAMALGMDYALGPSGDPAHSNPANKCDVVTISHGGLPSESWADAVNNLYEAGVVIVAASGDNFSQLPTHLTVYPSAFNRVVTAVGATYDKTPYVTRKIGELQGNWGPDDVMDKAIAAYTPNVAWMLFRTTDGFDMDGAGTSASTPQIAAACALWIQLYGANYAAGWQRVEACRLALFRSADPGNGSATYLGKGILDVPKMLDPGLAAQIQQEVQANQVQPSPVDGVSFPFLRLLLHAGPPGSEEDRMYETEAAQLVRRSTNRELVDGFHDSMRGGALTPARITRLRQLLKAEPGISDALAARL
jgi:Subtilase family